MITDWQKENTLNMNIKEKINQTDSLGNKQGFWRHMDPDGKLLNEGNFLDGRRHGLWRWYWNTGDLWFESEFVNGSASGLSKTYSMRGELSSKSYYVGGILEGEYIKFKY